MMTIILCTAGERACLFCRAGQTDVNHDDTVDVLDLLIILGDWGPCSCPCSPGDVNEDGIVDVLDLLDVLSNWQ